MGIEIERKFLIRDASWRDGIERSERFEQGYLATGEQATARVRVACDRAWLTIKGRKAGISRREFEYAIPVADGRQMLEELCGGRVVVKTRHWVNYRGRVWEVDEFEGENTGLVLAEAELASPDETIEPPPWIGEEVSDDPRYYNAYLAEHPYKTWS
ncbi:MAG: CYTH domain-containing protein [Gammaproteobacteria bacterium]